MKTFLKAVVIISVIAAGAVMFSGCGRKEDTVAEAVRKGHLNIAANDFEGEPLKITYWIYKKGDWKETLEVGNTNEPEDLPPGEYNVYVDSNPDAKYADVMIKPGEINEIKLPEFGALLVKWLDIQGNPRPEIINLYLYLSGGSDYVSAGYVNKRLDLPAGEYDLTIRPGLDPDINYKGIKITPGKVFEIELPDEERK